MPRSRFAIKPIHDSFRSGLKYLRRASHMLDSTVSHVPPRDREDLRSISARFHRLIKDAEGIESAMLVVQEKAITTPANKGSGSATPQRLRESVQGRADRNRPTTVRDGASPQALIVAQKVYWDLVKSQGRVCVKFEYRSLGGKVVRGICSPGILSSAMRAVQKRIRSACGRNETPTHFAVRRSGGDDVPRDEALAFIDRQIEHSSWKRKFSLPGELSMWTGSREYWESMAQAANSERDRQG